MIKLFWIATALNAITSNILLFTALKRFFDGHSTAGNIGTPFIFGLIFLALSFGTYLIWNTGKYQLALTCIVWVPWIVIVFSGSLLILFSIGEKWN